MASIDARGLRKAYRNTVALDGVDLRIESGRIVGLIGPNGAGKTTAINAILGLTACQGELRVLGRDPWAARDALMGEVCFIADVAILPRWLKVYKRSTMWRASTRASIGPRPRPFWRGPPFHRKAGCASCPRAWSPNSIWP